jgi:tetratricopeptide (TPR) repeat protein
LEIQPGLPEDHNNLGWVLLQIGRVDEAITQFQTALKLQPDLALAHDSLAKALLQSGRAVEAVAHYQTAVKLQPDNPQILSDLAWVLAAWPEASIRNGAQAIELAQRANQISGGQNLLILHTLAAAYAEAGRFAEAITTARRALELAESHSLSTQAGLLRSELKLYEAGTPLRDAGPTVGVANPGP